MAILQPHLHDSIEFSPDEDFENFLRRVPAKGAVYLLADSTGQPVQLLCVGNLRNSLKRRLAGDESPGPTRHVNYREFIRRIHWRRVDSTFEADSVYYQIARELFPQSYRGMIGFRPAWFIHIDPDADFPRYTKTHELTTRDGAYLGPFEDKHAAVRLIELLEDAFDLCRFHNILLEAPHGKPCAYKEMGRCPAPCDGSIAMGQYRMMIDWSLRVLIRPAPFIDEQTQRMQQAARELRFESAAKIKTFIGLLSELGKGAFRHARPLSEFRYLSLQRGPRDKTAKVFLITPGKIDEIFGLIVEPNPASDLILEISTFIQNDSTGPEFRGSEVGTDLIGIVTQHLFMAKQTSGVFLPLESLDWRSFIKAFRELQKQKIKPEDDEEGLVKELRSI